MKDSLTSEEFGRLSTLFGELRELEAEARTLALEKLDSHEEPGVVRELVAMLKADADDTPSRLDTPVGSLSGLKPNAPQAPPQPRRVGLFEIERKIGEGSFGTVYLGHRREPFKQRAAVKVLHVRHHSAQVLAWFEREIAVLAQIEHPGVVKILDAGLTDEGQPYLATEFVDGPAIDRYCREHELPVRTRLELVAQVCSTLQHAHQKRVVHRDLKPPNVLVSERDGVPMVRIIDFGTAKLLEPIDGIAETLSATLVGTPGYLSPEQIVGGEVDVRTDVYSIGILLAELVTGEPVSAWKAEAVSEGASRVESLPRRLGRWRKDLESIVRTATAIDQEKRYPSAAHLGDDLRAVLSGQPIRDRSRSPLALAAFYARRRPVVTAAVLALAAAVVVQSVRASVASHQLSKELDTQRQLVVGTLTDVVEQLGKFVGTNDSRRTLIESLLARTAVLERESPGDPELRHAIVRLNAARADLALDEGNLDLAGTIRHRVARELDTLMEELPPDVELARWQAEMIVKLGDVYKLSGDLAEAEAYYERALVLQRAALEEFPEAEIQLLDDICWSLERLVRWSDLHHDTPRYQALTAERLRRAEALVDADPSRSLSHHNLAAAERKASRLAMLGGTPRVSAQHADRAVQHATVALDAEPGRVVYQLGLAESLRCAGQVRAVLADTTAAESYYSMALSHLDRLLQDHPGDVRFQVVHIETLASRAISAAGLKNEQGLNYWQRRCEEAVARYGGLDALPSSIPNTLRSISRARAKLNDGRPQREEPALERGG